MKNTFLGFLAGLTITSMVFCLFGCGSAPAAQTGDSSGSSVQSQQNDTIATEQKAETAEEQLAKFERLFAQDLEPLLQRKEEGGEGWKATAADFDEILTPREMSGSEANKFMSSAELGKPYYFKIRAIYKGYDKENEKILLEDTTKTVSQQDELLGMAFGVDTTIYTVDSSDEPTKVTESNTLATFYCYGVRMAVDGQSLSRLIIIAIDDSNIKILFDKSKFIVSSGMSYITPSGVSVPTQQDAMMNMLAGGTLGNTSNIFDPIKYPLVDLMDARVAMDKKDLRNDYTFPTVRVKYVSEVVFKGQTNTTITVSTEDNVLTERMTFTGRASSVANGQKVRVYYTIAKDPLEEWEIQAIEKL